MEFSNVKGCLESSTLLKNVLSSLCCYLLNQVWSHWNLCSCCCDSICYLPCLFVRILDSGSPRFRPSVYLIHLCICSSSLVFNKWFYKRLKTPPVGIQGPAQYDTNLIFQSYLLLPTCTPFYNKTQVSERPKFKSWLCLLLCDKSRLQTDLFHSPFLHLCSGDNNSSYQLLAQLVNIFHLPSII